MIGNVSLTNVKGVKDKLGWQSCKTLPTLGVNVMAKLKISYRAGVKFCRAGSLKAENLLAPTHSSSSSPHPRRRGQLGHGLPGG
jgi:hypothetical protein